MTMVHAVAPSTSSGRRVRAVAAGALALAALCAAAPAAKASISISSLSVTASNDQAGGHPDIAIDAKFGSQDGDTPRDATISLGPGILASPSAATVCDATDFANNTCPASSEVGAGTVTGTVPAYSETVPIPVHVYLITPQAGEVARIGVIVDFFDYPVSALSAPVEIRTSPDVGIDMPLTGIPNQIEGTSVQVNEISLSLHGTVNGQPFTRMPTSCGASTTKMTADSYAAPTTRVSATADLTPTGCGSLTYAPAIGATATPDTADSGVAFAAAISQSTSDAATKNIAMTLPNGLAPRLSALSLACPSAGAPGCTAVGTATVTTPLLAAPLQGAIELVANASGLPFIDAVFPAPFAFTLQGSPTLSGTGLTATFNNLPDVPISNLDVKFDGGPSSILTDTVALCSGSPSLSASLTAQDGATAHLSPPVAVNGNCSAAAPSSTAPTSPAAPASTTAANATAVAGLSLSLPFSPTAKVSLSAKGPKLTVTVTAGKNAPALSHVAVSLPSGVSIVTRRWPHGLIAKQDGKKLPVRAISHRGGLQFSLTGKSRTLSVSLAGAILKLAKRLTLKQPKHHPAPTVTFVVKVKDAKGTTTVIHVSVVA
jgi:hypothetical protein